MARPSLTTAVVHVAAPPLGDTQTCVSCRTALPGTNWQVGCNVAHDGRSWYRPDAVISEPEPILVLCHGAN